MMNAFLNLSDDVFALLLDIQGREDCLTGSQKTPTSRGGFLPM
jgi:hypothetical protein